MITNLWAMKCGCNNRVLGLTKLKNQLKEITALSIRLGHKKVVVIMRGSRLILTRWS